VVIDARIRVDIEQALVEEGLALPIRPDDGQAIDSLGDV